MFLYDVNLLFAMLTPDHEHHSAARRWRTKVADKTWATSEITLSGFIRLACNPATSPSPRLPAEAWALLRANRKGPHHTFLSMTAQADQCLTGVLGRCQGYRQVTDALLLAVAIENNATLATFDSRLRHLSPDPAAVEVVPLL